MGSTLAYSDTRATSWPAAWPAISTLASATLIAFAFQVGTGGTQTADYYKQRGLKGYACESLREALIYCDLGSNLDDCSFCRTPIENLRHIRNVLNPAVADIAFALDVSRQAVYDWQNGKPITTENAARLEDLARAADVFAADGLIASAQLMRRPITSGKTLFDIAREGGSAEDAARNLAQRVRRELQQREMLAARLANRKRPAVAAGDYGMPLLDELD